MYAAYNKALEDALAVLDKISMSIDVNDRKLLRSLVVLLFSCDAVYDYTCLAFDLEIFCASVRNIE